MAGSAMAGIGDAGGIAVHRLPQLRIRLAELQKLRDEQVAKGRQSMAHYIRILITEAEAEIEEIERISVGSTAT